MAEEFKQTLKVFLVLLGVLVFGVLLGVALVDVGYIQLPDRVSKNPAYVERGEQQAIVAHVRIDYGNGDIQILKNQTLVAGSTVFGMLEQSGVVLETRNFPGLGVFIEAINGVRNSNNYYWQFWVNGEYSTLGASEYKLRNGDEILWKRTNERP